MKNIVTKNTSQRLGFDKLEATEIILSLNELLANYQVFFHKLQAFHWTVVGSDFFDVHDITEEMYRNGLEEVDDIAERVRVFGKQPILTMAECLRLSNIKESTTHKSGEVMILELISDISILLSYIIDVHEQSSSAGDIGSQYMMSKMMKNFETYHWQLSAWSNQKFNI